VNGVTYTYNSTLTAWTVTSNFLDSITANLVAANSVTAVDNVIASGNITGSYILGNGSQLTGLPAQYGDANVAAYLPTYTGNLAGGNIISTSAVSGATVSATGNIAGGNIATAGQYRQGGSAMMSVVQIGPAATNISYTGTVNAQYTLNPNTVPAGARYIFCDIFVTADRTDHQNFMFSRSNMGNQKNWVDTRGSNPANEFGNLTAQENTIITYYGESDGFTSNYGIWYPSQFLPSVGRTVWMNNYGNSGSNGYVYIIVKGYSL
jgi:hypothetical protein